MMTNDETVFMIAIILMLGFLTWLVISDHDRLTEQLAREVEACEKSGGVYVDNMRRVGKNTDHEHMCMNKNMFIFPEGEK
jgi:hypothetical protein